MSCKIICKLTDMPKHYEYSHRLSNFGKCWPMKYVTKQTTYATNDKAQLQAVSILLYASGQSSCILMLSCIYII